MTMFRIKLMALLLLSDLQWSLYRSDVTLWGNITATSQALLLLCCYWPTNVQIF